MINKVWQARQILCDNAPASGKYRIMHQTIVNWTTESRQRCIWQKLRTRCLLPSLTWWDLLVCLFTFFFFYSYQIILSQICLSWLKTAKHTVPMWVPKWLKLHSNKSNGTLWLDTCLFNKCVLSHTCQHWLACWANSTGLTDRTPGPSLWRTKLGYYLYGCQSELLTHSQSFSWTGMVQGVHAHSHPTTGIGKRRGSEREWMNGCLRLIYCTWPDYRRDFSYWSFLSQWLELPW